ncbi:MAG: metal-binding protein [Desulfovibrionaceae bacterium]|nr:metal-binding protein [Desulfovibrionaceae bacterium]MBF0514402.1 metal-binding protein [Desulfovibrionaceae bacterium]
MENSFRFFRNTACAYFPCHRGQDRETFNCLFCYCPLYFLDDCGGDFSLRRGVKDCTACVRPHAEGGYETVLARLRLECDRRRTG